MVQTSNPLIPLSVEGLGVGNAIVEGLNARNTRENNTARTDILKTEAANRTKILDQRDKALTERARLEAAQLRERRRAIEVLPKLATLEHIYNTKGVDAATDYAERNRGQLARRRFDGEDVDMQETNEVIDLLAAAASGDEGGLYEVFQQGRMAAQAVGLDIPLYSEAAGHSSASTQLFSNGTAILAGSDNRVRVIGPDGQEVSDPKERSRVLLEANEFESQLQGDRSASRAAGSKKIEIASGFFDEMPALERSIGLYSEAIGALKDGAQTGPWRKRLLGFTNAGIRLQNVQKQLGLNTLQMVTFGALSKGELDLVLEEAIPTGLDGPALISHLDAKRTATQKALQYTADAAAFLSNPDNDLQGWAEYQKSMHGSDDGISTVTTQAEYDALPSGAIYIEDGKQYRKP